MKSVQVYDGDVVDPRVPTRGQQVSAALLLLPPTEAEYELIRECFCRECAHSYLSLPWAAVMRRLDKEDRYPTTLAMWIDLLTVLREAIRGTGKLSKSSHDLLMGYQRRLGSTITLLCRLRVPLERTLPAMVS